MNQILIALLEYDSSEKRVMLRGVWKKEQYVHLPVLKKDNIQHEINLFEGHDSGNRSFGFVGLVPE